MRLEISNNDIEFELIQSIDTVNVVLGIRVKSINSENIIMTINITLNKDELERLKTLIG